MLQFSVLHKQGLIPFSDIAQAAFQTTVKTGRRKQQVANEQDDHDRYRSGQTNENGHSPLSYVFWSSEQIDRNDWSPRTEQTPQ
jgi:hypothetical protein